MKKLKYNFYPFNGKGDYELVLVNENKAVIRMNTTYMRAPYNGYVTFPTKDIPKDWWGNYNAGALQYLDIHGGITFCECYDNNEGELRKNIFEQIQKVRNVKGIDWQMKWDKTRKLELKANKKIGSLKDSYIVFGFDCGHFNDESNKELYNLEFVMKLTERMEQQLIAYAKIYKKWKKMNREEQIKTMEEIVGELKTSELGFGCMLDILAGGKSFKEGGEKIETRRIGKLSEKD